jgi:hypothetical protein
MQTMTNVSRISLLASAAIISLGLVSAPPAFAQDKMGYARVLIDCVISFRSNLGVSALKASARRKAFYDHHASHFEVWSLLTVPPRSFS